MDFGGSTSFVERLQANGSLLSGALFGAGWWLFIDSVVRAKLVLDQSFPDIFLVPGLIATFAALLMASFRRSSIDDSDDDGQCRSRGVLLFAYLVSLAALVASVGLLLHQRQAGEDMWLSSASVAQAALVLASGLVYWLLVPGSESDGYTGL